MTHLLPIKAGGAPTLFAVLALATAGFSLTAAPSVRAQAQTPPLLEPLKPGEAPKIIALVSAVGSQFQFVSARYQTASRTDPYNRLQVDLPNQALNFSVLRGLDRAVGKVQPDSKRVLLTMPAADIAGLSQSQRARAVNTDLLKKLEAFEQRKAWDYIIAVTPRYQNSGFNRMGDKLWGIGAYVYGLESASIEADPSGNFEALEIDTVEEVRKADGKGNANTKQFVAPYAYLRFTVYDAKTLSVIRTVDRLDSRKVGDPNCTKNNVFQCFDSAQYADMIDSIAERTAAAGISGKIEGRVEVGETKVVPASAPASSAPQR